MILKARPQQFEAGADERAVQYGYQDAVMPLVSAHPTYLMRGVLGVPHSPVHAGESLHF